MTPTRRLAARLQGIKAESPNATLMSDVQLIIDPARNPETSTAWIFGLRVRWDL